MAFYDSNPNQATASTSSASGHGQLPHLAPQGDLTISSNAPEVSLNFTEAQVEEYKEQDRFLPVCLGFTFSSIHPHSCPGIEATTQKEQGKES